MDLKIVLIGFLLMPGPAHTFSLFSTSSDLAKRDKELGEKRCATTLKRMQSFVKYWSPNSDIYANYMMYNPKKVGFRGYDLLGDIYFRGCASANLQPDKLAALTWYQHAAVAHLPESQWKLGRMLYLGDGVHEDKNRGLQWLTSAALEGSPDAANFLRSIGQEAPAPITPNTYTSAAMAVKQQLDATRAAQWRIVTQNLGELLVTTVTIAASAYAGAAAYSKNRAGHDVATPTQVTRFRPIYCHYTATANSYFSNSVNVRVTQMCQ